jgi:hypothetical protein
MQHKKEESLIRRITKVSALALLEVAAEVPEGHREVYPSIRIEWIH